MPDFTILPEIRVGDLLTTVSLLVAASTLIYGITKDRRLRRREYADRIRRSAADTIVGIERWRELAVSYFHEVQGAVTDADITLVREQNVAMVRDALWKSLLGFQASTASRVLAERLEGAYAGLYGYDHQFHDLYALSVLRMREYFSAACQRHLELTQQLVLEMDEEEKPFESTDLGNRLRACTASLRDEFVEHAESAMRPIRVQMLELVQAADSAIVAKRWRKVDYQSIATGLILVPVSAIYHVYQRARYGKGRLRSRRGI